MSKFVKVSQRVYNHYNYVHLFFYSFTDNGIKLLLSGNKEFSETSGEILDIYNSPIIAASVYLINQLKGLFSNSNLEKIISRNGELILSEPLPWYLLYKDILIREWLIKLLDNIVQYDEIEGHLLFFYELPNISLEYLNKEVMRLGMDINFDYLSSDDIRIKEETRFLLEGIDINNHINRTQKTLNDDSLINNFVFLSCDKYKPDSHFQYSRASIFNGLYRKNGERWLYYNSDSILPDHNILNKTKCIIIPGSALHIYHNPENLNRLKEFLINVISNYPHVKILGICFGHHFLAFSHGSNVVPKDNRIKISQEIKIEPTFWDLDFVKNSGIKKSDSLSVNQYHLDEVEIVMDDFNIYGKSESCTNEIIISKDGRILTLQGHPELTNHNIFYIENYSTMDENIGLTLPPETVENFEFRYICHSFLKN